MYKKEEFEVKVFNENDKDGAGFDIYYQGNRMLFQREPFIPYRNMSYKECGEKMIDEIIESEKNIEKERITVDKLQVKIEENQMQNAQAMAELTNLVAGMMGGMQ